VQIETMEGAELQSRTKKSATLVQMTPLQKALPKQIGYGIALRVTRIERSANSHAKENHGKTQSDCFFKNLRKRLSSNFSITLGQ
jgi:hypothetical protein